ncbi:MAG: haloalkane dehalogenase [Alcanivoracaceae bacterium]|nr:haloalkane dehalogenase [Alcanivoracaceae bacterium]
MDALRTPEERFHDLPDYPFAAHYLSVDDTEGGQLRMHYLDEGPADAPVVLMLHGEPSWSYLYRHMIGPVTAAGFRVIAPDLIGFGKSDKPVRQSDYSHVRHVQWVAELLAQLDLEQITLVCQDWGGLIGLRLVAEQQARFARVLAANTMLPGFPLDHPALEGIFGWRQKLRTGLGFGSWFAFSQLNPFWRAGSILQLGTARRLSAGEVAAYNAPFPHRRFMAGARVFPRLVPSDMNNNAHAWQQLMACQLPFLCAFSDRDPIMSSMAGIFPALVPGCTGQAHTTIRGASHFLQDDKGAELADVLVQFMRATP